jgi:hypothetical protein
MSDSHRLHREDPVRTGPIRRWSTPHSQSHSGRTQSPPGNQEPTNDDMTTAPADEVVAHGVRLGYRVVEEHLHQGQQVAQQLNTRSYTVGKMGDGIQGLAERVFRDAADLLTMWLDMVNTVAGNADAARNGVHSGQPPDGRSFPGVNGRGTSTMAAGSSHGTVVAVEIVASRPTQVTLDLYPRSEGSVLVTHGLRAVDPGKPALTDISFGAGPGGGPTRVRICVPEGQPPDLYTGVVVDKHTGQVCGTLSVQIAE